MRDRQAADILDRLRAGYSLPSLSVIATKLLERASCDTASVREMVGLIEKDPSLTLRLIRLANAALLRTGDPVTSVEQAIFRIGFNRLKIMALSLSLRDTFPMGRRGPMDYERFWKASLYKGLASKALAGEMHNCDPDEAFIAGLTQEIGLLILVDLFITDKDEEISLELYPLQALLSFESERYGVNHREIGEAALRYWQFPEHIIMCQRLSLAEAGSKHVPPLCLNSEIARVLSSVLFQKSVKLDDMLFRIEKTFGLRHDAAGNIWITVLKEVEEIAESLRVDVDKEKDIFDIMEKANKALAELSEQLSAGICTYPHNALPDFQSINGLKDRRTVQQTLQAAAHEIRNPLTSVGGFVRKLSAFLDSSSEGWQYMQIILEETVKLEQALSQMTRDAS